MLRKHELTINDGDGDRLELEYDQNHSHEYLQILVRDCDELSSVPVNLTIDDVKALHRYLSLMLNEMECAKMVWDFAEKELNND
jgi:hypothetical protein